MVSTTKKNNGRSSKEGVVIAVVDDDDPIRTATARLLQSFGFNVDVFGSAEDFLQSNRLPDISCLVLDLQMPGMSGLDLQRHLSNNGHRIPVIFISGSHDLTERVQAMNAGAVAYLQKPFREELLLKAIHAALKTCSGRT
jgi:FixJ family two-component response regulator